MRQERRQRRNAESRIGLNLDVGQRSGNLVLVLDKVSFAYRDRPVVRDFSTMVNRGDKVGIIGANGAGKTTLLRIMLGRLAPDQGTVRHGTNLEIAYFDQLRQQLDEDADVQQNVGDGYDAVRVAGQDRA